MTALKRAFDRITNSGRGSLLLAAGLVGALAAGVEQYSRNNTEQTVEEIKAQNQEILFSGNTGRLHMGKPITRDTRAEYSWIAEHHEMMQDTTNVAEFKAWLSQLDPYKDTSPLEKAQIVARIVANAIEYNSDALIYRQPEYIAAPLQTIRAKHGDCDDYSVLMYYCLKYLGLPEDKCFIMFVGTEDPAHVDHAVAAVDTSQTKDRTHNNVSIMLLDNDGSVTPLHESSLHPIHLTNRTKSMPISYDKANLP